MYCILFRFTLRLVKTALSFIAYRERVRDTDGFESATDDEILGVLTGILSTQDNAGSTLNKV